MFVSGQRNDRNDTLARLILGLIELKVCRCGPWMSTKLLFFLSPKEFSESANPGGGDRKSCSY